MTDDHTAYVELLAHVNCGNCSNYWGLSDVTVEELTATEWVCTHCGHKTAIGTVERNHNVDDSTDAA